MSSSDSKTSTSEKSLITNFPNSNEINSIIKDNEDAIVHQNEKKYLMIEQYIKNVNEHITKINSRRIKHINIKLMEFHEFPVYVPFDVSMKKDSELEYLHYNSYITDLSTILYTKFFTRYKNNTLRKLSINEMKIVNERLDFLKHMQNNLGYKITITVKLAKSGIRKKKNIYTSDEMTYKTTCCIRHQYKETILCCWIESISIQW